MSVSKRILEIDHHLALLWTQV